MKTILKLLFVGIVAGFTYKYITDNDINILNELGVLKDKAISFFDEFSDQETTNPSNDSEDINSDFSQTYQSYHSKDNSNEVNQAAYQAKMIVNAEEFPVPRRENQSLQYRELDNYAIQVPEKYTNNMDSLVSYLIKPATRDIEKARVLFSWIAHNISYDDYGYNTGSYRDLSADGVLKSRRAVCEGFAVLFKAMGIKAGLPIEKISGYAKGYGYRSGNTFRSSNHAWNAIKIDGNWKLFDVTWGEGHGTANSNGQLKSEKDFDDFWFDTDPYAFIFSHLPESKEWQIVDNPISKNDYENIPYVAAAFFKMGFDGKTCYNEVLSGNLSEFPLAYAVNSSVEALSLPSNGIINEGKALKITLKSADAIEMAVINNGKWTRLQKQGDEFTLAFSPERGELKVSARLEKNTPSFASLLHYKVR